MESRSTVPLPYAILGLLLAVWIGLGVWICSAAPYDSGTDESIRYVAFAAAKNRWASAEDAAAFKIEHYYYPPLYFLLFAPFYGDNPSFAGHYPPWTANLAMRGGGSARLVSSEDLARVPPELWRLYRTAKALSLLFGVGIVACLVASVRLVFAGESRPWLVLGTAGPLLLLPQFLYYQTLVNNDCLVNFLCALALYCFVAAERRVRDGDAAGARRRGFGCAAAVGLGLLTKQSAAALLPLLPALAWLQADARETLPRHVRFVSTLRYLALLAAVAFVAGGWWLCRSILAADPGGLLAAKTMHGWAIRTPGSFWELLPSVIGGVARSFIAMFAGVYYGIPDRIYAIYLSIAAALVTAVTFRAIENRLRTLPAPVWLILSATVALNLVLLLVFNLKFMAPHGRLLFPTLIASGLLFARVLLAISGGRQRLLAPLVGVLVLLLGGLFAWTFVNRMVPGVTQPAEKLVPLGVSAQGQNNALGPVWGGTVEQPALLPPGRLTGFRVLIKRTSLLPQFGTVIHASLHGLPLAAGDPGRACKPRSFGDSDNAGRWTDLELETPFVLTNMTPALLRLWADPPWLISPGADIYYRMIPLERSRLLKPMLINGEPSESGIAVTAVYDTTR